MNDKYLNPKEWQKFSSKQDYKDANFLKALSAVQKSASAAAITDLLKQGDLLAKAHKSDKPLATWLKGMAEAVKQLSTAADKTPAPDEAEEAVDHGALTDPKQLLKHLNSCRQDAERTIQFAYLEQSGSDDLLALSQRLAGRVMFSALTKSSASKKGAFGSLWVDGTTILLQLDKPLSGLVKKLRNPIQGIGFKFRLIQLMDAEGNVFESAEEASDAAVAEGDTTPAVSVAQATAPPAAPPNQGKTAEPQGAPLSVSERLKRLLSAIEKHANTLEAKAAKQLCAECVTLLKAGKSVQGEAALKKAETLIARLGSAKAPPHTPATPIASAPKPQSSKVAYTQTRLAWDGTRKHVQTELRKLEAAILKESADEPDFNDISKGVKKLYTVLDKLDTRLIDILDDALNAEDIEAKQAHQRDALEVVDDYIAYVDGGDPFLEAIDDNGFVEMTFLSVLKERLAGMKTQLEAAVA